MSKNNPWLALSALCVGFFMILLDTTIVNVAIPAMLNGVHASLNEIVWVNSIYLLTYAVPLLVCARLGDRFGPKRLFLGGLAVFTLASLWCGLAPTATDLIVARAVQGLGAAAMTPQTMAFIAYLFPSNRGAAMGVWGAVAGGATVSGPLLGGILVETLGWEWIFYVNVPVGLIGLVAAAFLVPDWQPRHSHRFDPLGILLSSAGMFALVFGIQNGQHYDWGTVAGPITVFEIITAGVLLLVAFVIWQRGGPSEPLLPLAVFNDRTFSAGNLVNITMGFALAGMFYPLTIYFQSVLGMTPLQAGLLTAPMSVLSGLVAPFAGRASDRISGKYVVILGLTTFTAGVLLLAWLSQPDSGVAALLPGLLLTGFGVGCVFAPLTNASIAGLRAQFIGAGSGIFNTSRQVGGVLGSAAIGVLLQARLSVSLPEAARAQAEQLPPEIRGQFVAAFNSSAGSAGEFAGATAGHVPPGVPPQLAETIKQAATSAFDIGFTNASKATLLLPAAVLLLGALFAAAMRRRQPVPVSPSAQPAPTGSPTG